MKILNRIDLGGISILIYGSTVSIIYYAFYCEMLYFYIYFTILTLSCGFVFAVSMQDWVYEKDKSKFRGNMYVALGIFSATSAFHMAFEAYPSYNIARC